MKFRFSACRRARMARLPLHRWPWLLLALLPAGALAERALLAVAANFEPAMQTLLPAFEERHPDHELVVSYGSSGKFYAQIVNGAPYAALLSADIERPERLEREDAGIAGTRFTYALGRLVLWSAKPSLAVKGGAVLATNDYLHLAIANPELAPYGAAAQAVLERLGLWQRVQPRLVRGENIAQTFQFVASEAAELGFVAGSQVQGREGSAWAVPQSWHPPIAQQAILLRRGIDNRAAQDWLAFLRNDAARALIAQAGYDLPAPPAPAPAPAAAAPAATESAHGLDSARPQP